MCHIKIVRPGVGSLLIETLQWSLWYFTEISKCKIFNHVLMIDILSNCHGNALRWMPLDLNDNASKLLQVMAWCCQAIHHYLNQCWLNSMTPLSVTGAQWGNLSLPRPRKPWQILAYSFQWQEINFERISIEYYVMSIVINQDCFQQWLSA